MRKKTIEPLSRTCAHDGAGLLAFLAALLRLALVRAHDGETRLALVPLVQQRGRRRGSETDGSLFNVYIEEAPPGKRSRPARSGEPGRARPAQF